MDHKTTVHELKEKFKKFCEDRDWDQFHNAKDLAIGIVNEASELLEHFRWKSGDEIEALFDDPNKRDNIEDEMADTLLMILRFAQMYNIDLTTALDKKMKKNEHNYPVEKVKGCNKKYSEY